MSSPRLTARVWILIFVLAAIWGSSFLFARIAVLEVPPLSLVFLRVALAALTLNLLLMFRNNEGIHTRQLWTNFAIMGIVNNIVPFGLIFYGQLEVGAGLAAIINAMTPIWTVIFANFWTDDEKISVAKIVGVILGFLGVAVLIGSSMSEGLQASTIGQLAILGATISYGVAGVFGRRFAAVPPVQTARGQLTTSSILILPFVLIFDQPWNLAMPSHAAIWSVIVLAILCTAIAYLLLILTVVVCASFFNYVVMGQIRKKQS